MRILRAWPATVALLFSAGSAAQAQSTRRISVDSTGRQGNSSSALPAFSADGRFIAFQSSASNLVAGDTNNKTDVFVHDRQSGTTERVSVENSGLQGNGESFSPALSADGRFVAFSSAASNLVVGDTNHIRDIFVRDRWNGTTERASIDSYGNEGFIESSDASISADGRVVAFYSLAANLVPGDTNDVGDIFVHDRVSGVTQRISVDTNGIEANAETGTPTVSGDGRFVAYGSAASNLVGGDTNGCWDVFVRDLASNTTTRVSLDSAGAQGRLASVGQALSFDGRWVVFSSSAPNLVAGDTNSVADVFVRDLWSGATERVSRSSAGTQANGASLACTISADGLRVLFASHATNLVGNDTNGVADVFLHELSSGSTLRTSVGDIGGQGNQSSWFPALSADGRFTAFASYASNLVAGDSNVAVDVFAHDLAEPPPLSFCSGDGSLAACPCANEGASGRGCENSGATGGARLAGIGSASLAADSLVLTSAGELPSVLSIFLQGDAPIAPQGFGDGLRCVAGNLKRLYAKNAAGGSATAPEPGERSISARSAALGDLLGAGMTRYYQTYYRDPQLVFCANPPGNSWNVSSGLVVVWGQ